MLNQSFNSLSYASRYLCRGTCLSTYKHISHKRLGLNTLLDSDVDKAALFVNKKKHEFHKAVRYNSDIDLTPEFLSKINSHFQTASTNFRETDVVIGNGRHFPPSKKLFLSKLNRHISYINNDINDNFRSAIFLYGSIVSIHPFSDGNGRTARAIYSILTNKLPFLLACPAFHRGNGNSYNRFISAFLAEPQQILRSSDFLSFEKKLIEKDINLHDVFDKHNNILNNLFFMKPLKKNHLDVILFLFNYSVLPDTDIIFSNYDIANQTVEFLYKEKFLVRKWSKIYKIYVFTSPFVDLFYKDLDNCVLSDT